MVMRDSGEVMPIAMIDAEADDVAAGANGIETEATDAVGATDATGEGAGGSASVIEEDAAVADDGIAEAGTADAAGAEADAATAETDAEQSN